MFARIQLHKVQLPVPVQKQKEKKFAKIFPLESKEKIQRDVERQKALIKTGDEDPTKLTNILAALKKTKKGSMKKPSFEVDPNDICIFKDVGDLSNFEASPEFSFKDPEPIVEVTPIKKKEEVEEEIDMEIPLFKTYYHENLLKLKMEIDNDLMREKYINTQKRCGNYCKQLAEIRKQADDELKAGYEEEEKLQLERITQRNQQMEQAILIGDNAGIAYGKEIDLHLDRVMEKIQQIGIDEAETIAKHTAALEPVHATYATFTADYDKLSNLYRQRGVNLDPATVQKYEGVSTLYKNIINKAKHLFITDDDILGIQEEISSGVQVLIAAASNIPDPIPVSVSAPAIQPSPERLPALLAPVNVPSMEPTPIGVGATQTLSMGVAVPQPTSVDVAVIQPTSVGVAVTQPTTVGVAVVQPSAMGAAVVQPSAVGAAVVQPIDLSVLTSQPAAAGVLSAQPTAMVAPIMQQQVSLNEPSPQPPSAGTAIIQPLSASTPIVPATETVSTANNNLPEAPAVQLPGATAVEQPVADYVKVLLPNKEAIHSQVTAIQVRYSQIKQKMDQVEQQANSPKNDSPVWINLARATGIINQVKNRANDSSNRSKLQQVFNLLAGRTCTIGEVSVSTEGHPLACAYIADHFSKNIVNLAHDLQVACAATYASLIVRIWMARAEIGELIYGRLCEVCPFLIPMTVSMEDGKTEAEYQRLLGMRPRESFDKYLCRMSNAGALYGRIVAMDTDSHPHGITEGWKFLARLLRHPPYPSVTASVLYGFLTAAGSALLREYGKQFTKVLYAIGIIYLPKMEANAVDGGRLDLESLKTLLVNFHQKQHIPAPEEGYALMI